MSSEKDALLSFARCFGADERKAAYVSSPITTGRSFLEWRRQEWAIAESHPRYADHHREHVVDVNLARAELVVRRARAAFPIVIDPTKLDYVDDWAQADYHNFWADIIAGYVHTVVFVDGWQFSSQCASDFAMAVRHRLFLLDERLQQLDLAHAVELLTRAAHELADTGVDASAMSKAAVEATAVIPP